MQICSSLQACVLIIKLGPDTVATVYGRALKMKCSLAYIKFSSDFAVYNYHFINSKQFVNTE